MKLLNYSQRLRARLRAALMVTLFLTSVLVGTFGMKKAYTQVTSYASQQAVDDLRAELAECDQKRSDLESKYNQLELDLAECRSDRTIQERVEELRDDLKLLDKKINRKKNKLRECQVANAYH